MWIFFYFVNLAAASPWLRRSWSPNYSVLVLEVFAQARFSLIIINVSHCQQFPDRAHVHRARMCDLHRMEWKMEEEEGEKENGAKSNDSKDGMVVELNPMQIRTFALSVERRWKLDSTWISK
jgi:hypothetical protein